MKIDLLDLIAKARSLRPNTKRAYENAVRQWIDFAGDDSRAWTAVTGQAFYEALLSQGIAAETANNMVSGGLAFAFKRAHALYAIPNIVEAIDKVKVVDDGNDGRHALTTPQAKALLVACNGTSLIDQRDHALVVLGLYTGMRRMSLVDVDLGRVADHGAYVTLSVILKGGDRYKVPLAGAAWKLTARYRESLVKARGRAGGPMFPGLTLRAAPGQPFGELTVGKALSEDGLYRALQKRAKAAGLSKFHPHLFRHTFSTWCRVANVEDYLIEVVTGHKSNRGMVHRVYTDETALYADVAARCAAAVTARIS